MLGDHVTTKESAIGAISGVTVWVLVIAYFCICRRPTINPDEAIREVIRAAERESAIEDKLTKIFVSKSEPSLHKRMLDLEIRGTDYKKCGRWNLKLEPLWDEKDIKDWSDESSSSSVGIVGMTRKYYTADVQLGLIAPAGLDDESSAIFLSSIKNEECNLNDEEATTKNESTVQLKCIDITKQTI